MSNNGYYGRFVQDLEHSMNNVLELVWTLHGGIFYFGIDKYFYQTPIEADLVKAIGQSVDALLEGAPSVFRSAAGK